MEYMLIRDKWNNAKFILLELVRMLQRDRLKISRKELLSHHGFMVQLKRTFIVLNNFLKGLQLTVYLWNP